jgi:ribosomal-protein-alanine N-acetyltransferase
MNMDSRIELTTARLLLKPITPEVIHTLFNAKTKEEIIQFFNVDEAGYDHLKNMHEKGMETFRISQLFFLICDKETNQVIGECGYHTWNPSHNRAEIFYGLRNDTFKQKGFMKEALNEVIDYGFNVMKLHRIQALIADSNTPSKKLLQYYGFVREGTIREDYVVDGKNEDSDQYSLLRQEWKKRS